MTKHAKIRNVSATVRGKRAAVLAVGLGTSLVLGTGAALAADAPNDAFGLASPTSGIHESVRSQADTAKVAADPSAWIAPVGHVGLGPAFATDGEHWAHKHSGQDFTVDEGTSVKAAHSGTVVKAGPNGGGDGPAYGNAIVVKHDDHTYSQYAHLSKVGVSVGAKVNTGQEIAKSGSTGNSTGPHLHFEIRKTADYGSAVEPVKFLKKHGADV